MISGETRLAGVIGDPVRHSRSPAIHNAAFEATGLDWVYVAFPVPAGGVPAAIDGMRELGIEGLSVTMPHKAPMVAAVDALTADATALQAVNCVFRDGRRLIGDNTDGGGFVDSLRVDHGVDLDGARCVVFGAGGAARAVVRALAGAGASDVAVVARRESRAEAAAALAGGIGRAAPADAVGDADLVVNATPVGMGEDRGVVVDPATIAGDATVADLVYHPLDTPLLVAARDRGLRTVDGLGMLVHQAARQFRIWTGVDAPLDAMRRAA